MRPERTSWAAIAMLTSMNVIATNIACATTDPLATRGGGRLRGLADLERVLGRALLVRAAVNLLIVGAGSIALLVARA